MRSVAGMTAGTAAVVARRYGLGEPTAPPAYADRGELGRIWRLDTDRGSWAVKEALVPVDEVAAAADVAFQTVAAAAGVPLPRPVCTTDGPVLLPGAEAGSPAYALRVYAWVDLDRGATVDGAQIGAVAARLHLLDHPAAGPVDGWFADPVGPAGWHALLADARRAGAPWAEPLRRRLPDLVALERHVRPPGAGPVPVCHLDLNVENVCRTRDGALVVLDWENSGPCRPERELAMVLADLAADLSPAHAAAAHRAYRAAGGPATVAGPADFSTAIAVQGHLFEVYQRRGLDPAASAEDRARSARRLARMLARPLTDESMAALLAAL
jgi:Ser/Thr protein kinase RdoA (MazF antagonist)